MTNSFKRNLECFFCNTNNFKFFDKYYHGKRLGIKYIYACNSCNLKQVDFIPSNENLKSFYGDLNTRLLIDLDENDKKYKYSFGQFDSFLKFIINKTKLNTKEIKNIIDIGAGNGRTLLQIKNLTKWDFLGVEPDDTKCKVLEYFNLKYVNDTFQNIENELKDNYYDLIIMSQVLEHIGNPSELLNKIYKKLNQNGYLWVDVPLCNKNYFETRLIDDVGHLYFFDEVSLYKIMKKSKFNIISFGSYGKNMLSKRSAMSSSLLYIKYFLHRYFPIKLLNLRKKILKKNKNLKKIDPKEIFNSDIQKIEENIFKYSKLFFLVKKN
jgi:SAM-dependent methyltransferase